MQVGEGTGERDVQDPLPGWRKEKASVQRRGELSRYAPFSLPPSPFSHPGVEYAAYIVQELSFSFSFYFLFLFSFSRTQSPAHRSPQQSLAVNGVFVL